MRVLDPGHRYTVDGYDAPGKMDQLVTFMKREGVGYPGNKGTYPGTNCQELLRVLIDRVKYLDKQIPCFANLLVLSHLRNALYLFEYRAATNHGMVFKEPPLNTIEDCHTCLTCGHIQCHHGVVA